MPRILILTASMGEGHNTAARNIRDALMAESGGNAEVLAGESYTRTNPVINKLMQKAMRQAINRYPRAWKVVFELLSKRGVVEGMGPMLAELRPPSKRSSTSSIRTSSPRPIRFFPSSWQRFARGTHRVTVPFYTVITDSTMINSAWYRCPCDGSIVADEPDRPTSCSRTGAARESPRTGLSGWPGLRVASPAPPPSKDGWKAIFFPSGHPISPSKCSTHLAEFPRCK